MITPQDELDPLLEKWEDLRAQGRDVSLDDLRPASPELLPLLKSRIEQLEAMDWLDDPIDAAPASDESAIDTAQADPLFAATIPKKLAGRYELESLVAVGGFGQVWRARDTALQRWVAIKVTTVDCVAEAQRVAQLKHHGIVSVHDVGREAGVCFIVFDLVEGSNLAERIERMPFTWRQAVRIVAQVAEYVHHAHQKGFLHRDIKPANILLDEQERPVLADFGIAISACELQNEIVTSVGTLAYMSPEQLTGNGRIDVRADVYGLGVVLYELLVGSPPFDDRTVSGLREKILAGGPAPPRSINPHIPAAVDRICLKCLATNPVDRYATAKDLSVELKKLLDASVEP